MTLAPERRARSRASARLRDAGVTVSLGHTDATFDQMLAGIDAGATLVTHLYNAMSPFQHRAPGAVGAALTDDRVAVALIADGVHAHPAALNVALRAKGAGGVVLVTDAIAAAGAPPGRYQLAGVPVVSDGASARLTDGTLAGSTLTMDRAVRAMVSLGGARLEDALAMASSVPAAIAGLADTGRIAVGQVADLTSVVGEHGGRGDHRRRRRGLPALTHSAVSDTATSSGPLRGARRSRASSAFPGRARTSMAARRTCRRRRHTWADCCRGRRRGRIEHDVRGR